MTARALEAHVLADLRELVAHHLGLHFPNDRWTDLDRGIASAARELGQSPAAFADRLLRATDLHSAIELLAQHLTVGETYFFREQEMLEAFEQQIVPELLRTRMAEGDRRIRIWSAGCSTGEEPYTIAMLLDRAIPDLDRWNVTILATDVNDAALAKGTNGEYGRWSFRGTPAAIRERYFREHRNGRFELLPKIRSRITFSRLNLASDAYPSAANGTNAMDVIFCRNVLMYFTPAQAKAIAGRFQRALRPDGVLIVSAAEASNSLFSSFRPVHTNGITLYRNSAPRDPAHAAVAIAEVPRPSFPQGERSEAAASPKPSVARRRRVPAADPVVSAMPAADVARLAAEANAAADRGDFAEAVRSCERAIAADKLNPAHRYLLAAVQQEMGDARAAIRTLGQVLYLAPDFALAHFALARLALANGRRDEAAQHLGNTLAALRDRQADEVLPHSSDLITAGRLAEISRTLLRGVAPQVDRRGVSA